MFMPYQLHHLLLSRDFKLIHAFNSLFYSCYGVKKENPARSKARTNNKLKPHLALGEKKYNGIDDAPRKQEVSYFAAIHLSNIVTG